MLSGQWTAINSRDGDETPNGLVDANGSMDRPDNKVYPNAEMGNRYPIAVRPRPGEGPSAPRPQKRRRPANRSGCFSISCCVLAVALRKRSANSIRTSAWNLASSGPRWSSTSRSLRQFRLLPGRRRQMPRGSDGAVRALQQNPYSNRELVWRIHLIAD